MKAIANRFFVFSFFLFGILNGMSKTVPPAPNSRTAFDPGGGHPGLTINEHLLHLIILAIFFGIYIIYTRKLDNKSPV